MVKDEDKAGLVFFLAWTLLLIISVFLAGFNGLYGMDSHEYLRYCNSLVEWVRTGVEPGKFFWPVNYPMLGALLSIITGTQPALQLLSIMASAWILYLLAMVLFREFPGREREILVYVILFMGLSPFFFRYAVSIMTDITALAFSCTAFYLLYLHVKCQNRKALYVIPTMISLAVFTRFAMAPLLLPVAIYAVYLMFKSFRVLSFLISWIAALLPVVFYYYMKTMAADEVFHQVWISGWSFTNYFNSNFETVNGYSEYLLPNIIYVLYFLVHPGFIFPGIIFLAILLVKKSKPMLTWPVMLLSMGCYLIFLAGLPTRNDRFLVMMLPFYILICFPAYLSVLAYFHHRVKTVRLILFGAFLLQVLFLVRAFLPFYKLNQIERQLTKQVQENDPSLLYTFGMEGALRSYGYRGDIVTLWPQRLDTIKAGSMLLFNRSANEQQWKGLIPMLNFEMLKDSGGAVLRENAGNGWEIYEIKKAYPVAGTGFPR